MYIYKIHLRFTPLKPALVPIDKGISIERFTYIYKENIYILLIGLARIVPGIQKILKKDEL